MESLTITVVYDNHSFDHRLKTAWGFSALVEYMDQTLLFDTGQDSRTLLSNLNILGIDPGRIEKVILSHNHLDHTGGLRGLLKVNQPKVYLTNAFSSRFKRRIARKTEIVQVSPGQLISNDLFTTGEMSNRIEEQSLIIKTNRGLIILTGCAHPGIVNILERAKELIDAPIYLAMGGFHLKGKNMAEMTSILAEFDRLGVEKVAPSHCTGDQSIARFADKYRENYIKSGVGKILHIENATG